MNHQKIALLTDSCADLSQELRERYHIFVLPLRLLFSDGEYLDGETMKAAEVYERLPKELPVTSLPSADMVQKIFDEIRAQGYEHVLAVHLSSGLSGTYNLVRLMAEETTDLDVQVFDSGSGSLGIGMTLIQAGTMIEKGCTWEQLLDAVPEMLACTKVLFCIDTLEYLQKGGRIGKITAMTGTLLQIKPIITFGEGGQLTNTAKGRGRKTAVQRMLSVFEEARPKDAPFVAAVADGNQPEEAEILTAHLRSILPEGTPIVRGQIDCTLAAYVGPNLLGVGFQVIPQVLR